MMRKSRDQFNFRRWKINWTVFLFISTTGFKPRKSIGLFLVLNAFKKFAAKSLPHQVIKQRCANAWARLKCIEYIKKKSHRVDNCFCTECWINSIKNNISIAYFTSVFVNQNHIISNYLITNIRSFSGIFSPSAAIEFQQNQHWRIAFDLSLHFHLISFVQIFSKKYPASWMPMYISIL